MKTDRLLQELLKEVEYELFHYPFTSRRQNVKYIVKRLLKPVGTPKKDSFFWPHAMLALALESAGNTEVLKKYYDLWIEKDIPVYNLDNVMNGYSLLYVYKQTKEKKYEEVAHRLYGYICNYKREMGNTLPYRRQHPKHVYVDAVGMIVPFLCRYGKEFEKKEAIDLGTDYLLDFLKYGMDEKTGLPYHGYDLETKVKYGVIGWGRAVGWLMLGMADSMEYISNGEKKVVLQKFFWELTDACVGYLRKDGYFSWQLTALEGPKDTSATAMVGYAVQKAIRVSGIENQLTCSGQKSANSVEYQHLVAQTKMAILSSCKNGNIYDCSGECEGFSQYPQVYGAYPWSLGVGVRLLLD